MSAFGKLAICEIKLILREPLAVFFTLALPTILIIVLGSIPAFRRPDPAIGGGRVIDLYLPITIALVLGMLALQMAPVAITNYRERGILRRMSTTPMHPAGLLAAQGVANLATVLASTALMIVVGRIAFAVPLPRQFLGYVVVLLFATAAMLAIGLFISSIAPNGKAGNAIGVILFFPVMFFAGLYTPREVMPAVVNRIGDFTPLGAGVQALHDAATGSWPHAGQLLVLAAYLVACGVGAARLFRWE